MSVNAVDLLAVACAYMQCEDIVPVSFLTSVMSPNRYAHCVRVAEMADRLLGHHQGHAQHENQNNSGEYPHVVAKTEMASVVRCAALWHDVAKELTPVYFAERGIPLSDDLIRLYGEYPLVWHAFSGPVLLRRLFGVKNKAILRAVRHHTTGCADMSQIDMLIYVSDAIEPGRAFGNRDIIQDLAFERLHYAVFAIVTECIAALERFSRPIHPNSLGCRRWIESALSEKEKADIYRVLQK